jgi:hypothetical protein
VFKKNKTKNKESTAIIKLCKSVNTCGPASESNLACAGEDESKAVSEEGITNSEV